MITLLSAKLASLTIALGLLQTALAAQPANIPVSVETPPITQFQAKEWHAGDGNAAIREYIVHKAKESGVNPSLALFIAQNESNFIPSAKNPKSSAQGIFQILIGTWKYYGCEGERLNYQDNTDCALHILKTPNGLDNWKADPTMRAKLKKEGY